MVADTAIANEIYSCMDQVLLADIGRRAGNVLSQIGLELTPADHSHIMAFAEGLPVLLAAHRLMETAVSDVLKLPPPSAQRETL